MSDATPLAGSAVPVETLDASPPASLWSDAWKRLRRNRAAVLSAVFLVWICLTALAAPWLPGLHDPAAQNLSNSDLLDFPTSGGALMGCWC